MSVVLKFVDGPHAGRYLRAYNPDHAEGRFHSSIASRKPSKRKANPRSLVATTRPRPSTVHPIRLSDGKPNRPMTAWSVAPEAVE